MKDFSKIRILSAQKWNNYFPLQVVFEWENILSKTCNIKLDTESQVYINKKQTPFKHFLQKVIRNSFLKEIIDSSFNYLKSDKSVDHFIAFLLYPLPVSNHYIYQSNVIPIILDCFSDVINKVPELFKKNPAIFVTNLEVYEKLKDSKLSGKIHYMPLSISDEYYTQRMPLKTIDVIQLGRKNLILHEWMMQVTRDHPEVEYVYSSEFKNMHGYTSTKNGWLGTIDTRSQFMEFLGTASISLLSSPGIDASDKKTGGYNPVTPRFYEAAVKYCYMIGRYPDAPDFNYNHISNVCERAEDYAAFEKKILNMLSTPFNQREKYDKFIEQHLTSSLAKTLEKVLNKL